MSSFFVDPDIRKAHTPPPAFYTGEDWFARSKKEVFRSSWQLAGTATDIRSSGQVQPHTLLEGFLDEPILFSRDANDAIHCLSNVCTHRGNLLVEGACTAQHIRCRYHGRRFGLNGKFQFMPEFDSVENFPSAEDDLTAVPFDRWNDFLFASVQPKQAFGVVFGDMIQRMSWLPVNEFRFDAALSRDYLVKANWALYCENYLEGFHIPYVHPSLSATVDYNTYATELFTWSCLQIATARGGVDAFAPPAGTPDHGKSIAAYYWWVFPNLMFNFYPWGLSVNIVRPLNPGLTRVSFLTYVHDESRMGRGAGADLDKVEREDEAIVETVQKGLESSFYKSGRYSPKREQGTHHFHRLLADCFNS